MYVTIDGKKLAERKKLVYDIIEEIKKLVEDVRVGFDSLESFDEGRVEIHLYSISNSYYIKLSVGIVDGPHIATDIKHVSSIDMPIGIWGRVRERVEEKFWIQRTIVDNVTYGNASVIAANLVNAFTLYASICKKLYVELEKVEENLFEFVNKLKI